MKPLYTQEQFDNTNTKQYLPIQCYYCNKSFLVKKSIINLQIKNHSNKHHNSYSNTCLYCSRECQRKNFAELNSTKVNCFNCNKEIIKPNSRLKYYKIHFCSKSCGATYKNTHKTTGYKRSKIELYVEKQLNILYPNLNINYNKTNAINSELDIYIPSLKLGIELNGIFHYEPIFGTEKLLQIQNNDSRKFQACAEQNISLCIIDISSITYIKPEKMQKYINIITNIINDKINSQ